MNQKTNLKLRDFLCEEKIHIIAKLILHLIKCFLQTGDYSCSEFPEIRDGFKRLPDLLQLHLIELFNFMHECWSAHSQELEEVQNDRLNDDFIYIYMYVCYLLLKPEEIEIKNDEICCLRTPWGCSRIKRVWFKNGALSFEFAD